MANGLGPDMVGCKYGVVSVSDTVVLDREHKARVGSEVRISDKLEVDDPAGSVAVIVLLRGHEEGGLR
jgi:hypothetical protein